MTNPFTRPSNITVPEMELIKKSGVGEWCSLGKERPDAGDRDTERNVIRANVIMYLAHGGEPNYPVHPKGVQLRHAWIDDALDFQSCIITRPLVLENCHFAEEPNFLAAQTGMISLFVRIVL